MFRMSVLALLLLALACGGGSPGGASPQDLATTPEGAVRNFMQALADSNITRMARYWGTARGPASETRQPADYVQRLSVTQAFLRDSPFKVVRSDPDAQNANRQMVQVDFDRSDADGKRCVRNVLFTTLKTGKQGWIVNAIDLTRAGTPGRACSVKPGT